MPWRLVPTVAMHVRHWDGEHILYAERSGDTHLVDELTVSVIEQLAYGVATPEQLARDIAAADGANDDDELVQRIECVLIGLYSHGLTETVFS